MKKLLAMVLALCMVFALCACSQSKGGSTQADENKEDKTYAKVTFSNGTTETLKLAEIPAMIHENQYAYNNKYAGNKIEIVTTVTNIGSSYGMAGFVPIDFQGGWNCYLKEATPVIIDLRNGMLVKVTGTLTTDSWSIQGATITILE